VRDQHAVLLETIRPTPSRTRYFTAACHAAVTAERAQAKTRCLLQHSGLVDGRKDSEYAHTFANWQIDKLNKGLHDFLLTWDAGIGDGVYLTGACTPENPSGNGTGKSYALHALTNRLCREGIPARFCRTSDFLLAIRASYSSEHETDELETIREFGHAPVLLWDDLGKESFRSDWGPEKFYQVIDDRCRTGLPLVISSNFTPDALESRFGANFGPAIVSRLAKMCPEIYQLGGADRRFAPLTPVTAQR
jgi:DNA replication protein DnaC